MEEELLVLGQGVENDGRQLVGLSLPWSFWVAHERDHSSNKVKW